jgi:hypothetical protein
MCPGELKHIDSDAAIAGFLNETNRLHSCVTSVEFHDGRFVDQNGAMHVFLGDQASLTLRIDRQSKPTSRYVLVFEGVTRFDYNHNSAYDGIIQSCTVSIVDGIIRLECNEWDSAPSPLVHAKAIKYMNLTEAAQAAT